MRVITFLLFVFYVALGFADEEKNAKELSLRLSQIKTLSASFKQQITNDGQLIQQSKGTIRIKKPMRFLWSTKKPTEQRIIADGEKLWVYDLDLEQVSVSDLGKTIANTPAAFLSKENLSLSNNYTITKKRVKEKVYYKLVPKKASHSYLQIVLGFKDDLFDYISVKDQLSQMTRLWLTEVRINQPLANSLFTFTPPKGVDLITNG